jgi:hypothetical protein
MSRERFISPATRTYPRDFFLAQTPVRHAYAYGETENTPTNPGRR